MGKKPKTSELGRALAKRKNQDGRTSKTSRGPPGVQVVGAPGRHLSNEQDSKLQSVLDATDLEELMLNATLANEDFTAQRYPGPLAPQTVVVAPHLHQSKLIPDEERDARRELDRSALRIPRRPSWNTSTTYDELMTHENEEFLKWRRRIAQMEEEHSLSATIGGPMMTPFEKNLEVWRQLWRVVERSDVVMQIVDARNPLLYYCEDMYRYVTEEMGRAHVLLLNKSDLLSSRMIGKWEAYFSSRGIDVIFFSAFQESVKEQSSDDRIVGAEALIKKLVMFERKAPQTQKNQRIVVGMCGYPNVGKSSTVNVLLETVAAHEAERSSGSNSIEGHETDLAVGENMSTAHGDANPEIGSSKDSRPEGKSGKRVAVSSTPGKTKHFQTLVLTDELLLCDCPGLVFPNFSSSKAELICAGVLSIDQMRGDHLTPVSLIASRIPGALFEALYGIRFPEATDEVLARRDSSSRRRHEYVQGSAVLETHARARGFMTDHGRADTSRSARVLLKDYVNGRIIYAHGPNGDGESGVGPAVFAKKGKLVYERKEAWAEVRSAAENKELNVRRGAKLSNTSDGVGSEGVEGGTVRARVSSGKKNSAAEFVRVERSFYPDWWGSEDKNDG